MDKATIDPLISRWCYATLDLCEEDRIDRLPDMTDDEVKDQWTGCSMAYDEAQGALLSGDYKGIHGEIQELLLSATLPPLDPASRDFARLARAFLRAKQTVYREEMRRWSGDYSSATLGLPTAPVAVAAAPHVTPTQRFSEVATLYLKEHHTRSAKTQGTIQANVKTFLKVIGGDRPLGEITKAHCRTYKESLVSAKLQAASSNKYLKGLSHFLKWAKGQGFVGDTHVNPVEGLLIAHSIEKKESLKRRPFTSAELQRVVQHPDFQVERTAHPERWWIVWLCLYAGLRREEAAQLLVSQVVQDAASGVWFLDIIEAEESEGRQSLKNTSSRRRVPLHADLLTRLGFLEYLAVVKKSKHSRLFYQCHASPSGYGDATGKWFGRFLHHTLKLPPSVVLHSCRHGFITGLHAAAVPDQLVFALCGHTAAGGEVHAGYTHRDTFPLKVLSEAVNKLDFGLV